MLQLWTGFIRIKTDESIHLTRDGVFKNDNKYKNFLEINNLSEVHPGHKSEIDLMRILYNAEYVVFSWGTTYLKNWYYTSPEKCKMIITLIPPIPGMKYNNT